jgi:hypothetical protein
MDRHGEADVLRLAGQVVPQEPVHDILGQVPAIRHERAHLRMGEPRLPLLVGQLLQGGQRNIVAGRIPPLEEDDLPEVVFQAQGVQGARGAAPHDAAKPLGQVGHHEGVLPQQGSLLGRDLLHDLVHGDGKGQVHHLVVAQDHHGVLHGHDLPPESVEG